MPEDFCYIAGTIDPLQCIGNSLSTINYNFSALDLNLCQLSAMIAPSAFNPDYLEQADRNSARFMGHFRWSANPHLSAAPGQASLPEYSNYGDHTLIDLVDGNSLTESIKKLDFSKNRKLNIKLGSTSIIRNPSTIIFSTAGFNVANTGSNTVTIAPKVQQTLVLRDSINVTTPDANTTLYTFTSRNPGNTTETFNITTLNGYNSTYNFMYVFYSAGIANTYDSKGGHIHVNLGGVPCGSVSAQDGDYNYDSGYVFIKIPTNKLITIQKISNVSGAGSQNPHFSSRIYLYGWAV